MEVTLRVLGIVSMGDNSCVAGVPRADHTYTIMGLLILCVIMKLIRDKFKYYIRVYYSFLDRLLVVTPHRLVFMLLRRRSVYSPRGVKAFEGSLGLDTPMALTAKIRTSYGTPSIIFLGSNAVSLIRSKFSLIHLELCFFFLSMK